MIRLDRIQRPAIEVALRSCALSLRHGHRPLAANCITTNGLRRGPIQQRSFILRKKHPAELGSRHVLRDASVDLERLSQAHYDYWRNRMAFLAAGAITGIVSALYIGWKIVLELRKGPEAYEKKPEPTASSGTGRTQFDAGNKTPAELAAVGGGDVKRKVVLHDDAGREIVPTNNSVVKSFPRHIRLPALRASSPEALPVESPAPSTTVGAGPATATTTQPTTEYTLVGLGQRTVTWLRLPVYLVGFYVATEDIAALQAFLVRRASSSPLASTLVPDERETLKKRLLDPEESTELWDDVLAVARRGGGGGAGAGIRSVFRIVPVRDTDLHHIRDGFFRAVVRWGPQPGGAPPQHVSPQKFAAGAAGAAGKSADDADDPDGKKFSEAAAEFRSFFKHGRMPKRSEMLLCRAADGALTVLFDDGKTTAPPTGKDAGVADKSPARARAKLGWVGDPRISRTLWMNFLAGPIVASEEARANIAEGILEFVERPVGTVATQVVPVGD